MSENNKNIEIPVQGNLGLLAYGDIALKAWRKKRDEHYEKIKDKESKEDKKEDKNG
jgi:hypothetical protein